MADDPAASDAVTVVGITPSSVLEGGSRTAGDGLLLQLRTALAPLPPGAVVELRSTAPSLREDLVAWCQLGGHTLLTAADAGRYTAYFVRKESSPSWEQPEWGVRLAQRQTGVLDMRDWFVGRRGSVPDEAPTYYGFVPRGAVAESGLPAYPFRLNRKADVWTETLADLYEQATAQQWHAATDIPWATLPSLPDELERAVCQVMTFLVENEYAALYIPARFLPRINAQYIEAVLFLSTVINDEARHIEVFTKRALANGGGLQVATALTEWSLYSLMVQEDYFRSSFLLHVLGEGTFLDLLEFVERHAPDPVTAEVVRRARQDEGRHVAYGIAHVREQLRREPTRVQDLIDATEERAAALQATSGANVVLNEALAVLAGDGSAPSQMTRGTATVRNLFATMSDHRFRRLLQVGLDSATAAQISSLHTPNFM